jgi:hypothetical protein
MQRAFARCGCRQACQIAQHALFAPGTRV